MTGQLALDHQQLTTLVQASTALAQSKKQQNQRRITFGATFGIFGARINAVADHIGKLLSLDPDEIKETARH